MVQERKSNELCLVCFAGANYPTKHRKYLFDLVRDVAIKENPAIILVAGNTVDGKALKKEYNAHLKHDLNLLKSSTRNLAKQSKASFALAKKLGKQVQKAKKSNSKKNKEKVAKLQKEIKKLEREAEVFSQEAQSFEEGGFQEEFQGEFIEQHAQELSSLFPLIPGVNYHIAIAQDVYDLQVGVDILERVRDLRDDIRLIGAKQDGTYDPEPKVPSQLKGFEEIRLILPRRSPWFYRIISSFMQRLINSFIPRTFSPQPDLILIGCSGTSIYLPNYEGVPSISIPHLDKLDEQLSTENMIGVSVVKMIVEKERKRIIWKTYDFRPAIFNEREFSIPSDTSPLERAVLHALIQSPASSKTVQFRILGQDGRGSDLDGVTPEMIKQALQNVIQRKIVVFNRKSNQYAISEKHLRGAQISLEQLFKNSKSFSQTITSCFHCGCLKTLYHTCFNYLPENALNSDVLVENGDGIQGIAHAYEYSGELLPTMMAYDKQELYLASIRRKNILDIFKLRLAKCADEFQKTKSPPLEIAERCLIEYIFQTGNHPGWKYFQKHSLILAQFESELKAQLIDGVLTICAENKIDITYQQVKELVGRRVRRVGESFMIYSNGFSLGVKHPYKSRTESKSHRIQDVISFTWREFFGFIRKTLKKSSKESGTRGFVVADIANFHEAAAVHVAKYGRTALGVMTGAQLKDTRFESHLDKVVDHGTANVTVVKNEDDRLLYSEVEFDDRIHPDDEKICFADTVQTEDVLDLCQMLDREAKMPWRY